MRGLKTPLVDLKTEYASIRREVDEEISSVLTSAVFVLGAEVVKFENEFAAFCRAKHATGVGSRTAAVCPALLAMGIGESDEVVTTPSTFVATIEAFSHVGAKPIWTHHRFGRQ